MWFRWSRAQNWHYSAGWTDVNNAPTLCGKTFNAALSDDGRANPRGKCPKCKKKLAATGAAFNAFLAEQMKVSEFRETYVKATEPANQHSAHE